MTRTDGATIFAEAIVDGAHSVQTLDARPSDASNLACVQAHRFASRPRCSVPTREGQSTGSERPRVPFANGAQSQRSGHELGRRQIGALAP